MIAPKKTSPMVANKLGPNTNLEIENLNNDQVNKILPIINDMKNLISLWK